MRTTSRTGLRTGTPRWARRGPSISAEIAHILWLPRPTPTSNIGNPLRSLSQFSQLDNGPDALNLKVAHSVCWLNINNPLV